jgi:hypothetical protein
MKSEELQRKLLAAARANPPGEQVPFAFEKRITALLKTHPAPDLATLWAGALWRAVVPCVVVTVLLGAWTFIPNQSESSGASNEDLSQHFEQTLLAAVDQTEDVE